MSIVEILLITIFLPVTLIPYLDIVLFAVQSICFICGYIIAFLGLVPQDYVKYEQMKNIKIALKEKGIKRNLRNLHI